MSPIPQPLRDVGGVQGGGDGVRLGSGRWLFADDMKMEALLRDNEALFDENRRLNEERSTQVRCCVPTSQECSLHPCCRAVKV